MKVADEARLEDYFVYIGKGINGKEGDRVAILYEEAPRLWGNLHEQYHRVARERRDARLAKGPLQFYEELAAKCREERKTSKEDVLKMVVNHYVRDSSKGFSSFQIQATFGRVFSLVNGTEAEAFFYDVASSALFKW